MKRRNASRAALIASEHDNKLSETDKAHNESEPKFRTLVSNIPGAVYRSTFDSNRTMNFISDAIEDISGYPAADFLGNCVRTYASIIHPHDRKVAERAISEAVKQKKSYAIEYQIIRPDRTVRWVYEHGQATFGKRNKILELCGAIFDITEHKRQEDRLEKTQLELACKIEERTADLLAANEALQEQITERQRLETEILATNESQQQRIGQELHDGLGQLLTGIAITSKALERNLAGRCPTEAAGMAKITQLVNQGISQIRHLAKGLYPIDLHTNSLASALQTLVSDTKQLFGISCCFKCNRAVVIDDTETKVQLYRIAQEAVTNAIKHGKAKNVLITMAASDTTTTLTIADDGLGLPQEHNKNMGMGLNIMRYRAKVVGASLDIRPGETGGVVVSCLFRSKDHRQH